MTLEQLSGRTAFLRSLAEGVAAGAVGLGLAAQAEPGDPFRGTLAVLPLVVAGLRAIERHAGARRTPPLEGGIAALLLGGLVAATLARLRLGLVAVDWFLAAGFLLLLGQRTARLLLALRPCLGRKLPRRPSAAFFWLPFVVYLAIQPWSGGHRQPDGDEPYYLLVTHSLAHDFDLDLANNYPADWRRFMERAIEPQIGDPVGAGGEQYSRHSFLLPLLLAPAYALAGRAGAMTVMAALTAALAWMVLRLARHYAPRRPTGYRLSPSGTAFRLSPSGTVFRLSPSAGTALLAYGLFAFCPPLLLYSYQIWVEVPAALLTALVIDGAWTLRRSQRWDARGVAAVMVPLVLLPVLKIRFALLAVPLFVLACWRARPPKRVLRWLTLGLGATAAGLVLFNVLRFGNPLRLYSWNELDLFRHPLANFVRGGAGMFYDSAFGLFPSAPIWCLLLPALALWLRAGSRGSLPVDLALVAGPYLLFVAPRIEWFGGWSPPFRYALVFLPLLAIGLVPVLERRAQPLVRTLIVALGAATLVLAVVWVVIPGWTYNFADGRTHLLDAAGVRLDADVARFFPSTIRPRAATWCWLAASLLLVPAGVLAGRRSEGRSRQRFRSSSSSGVALLLLLLASLATAGRFFPTRVVHLEDGFVGKYLGSVHPPTWTLQRPKYHGGWSVPAGGWLVAPVTPGGERVTIEVAARLDTRRGIGRLWIWAGDRRLASLKVDPNWSTEVLGPFDWPAGERLLIRGDDMLKHPVIVDRAELVWQ